MPVFLVSILYRLCIVVNWYQVPYLGVQKQKQFCLYRKPLPPMQASGELSGRALVASTAAVLVLSRLWDGLLHQTLASALPSARVDAPYAFSASFSTASCSERFSSLWMVSAAVLALVSGAALLQLHTRLPALHARLVPAVGETATRTHAHAHTRARALHTRGHTRARARTHTRPP